MNTRTLQIALEVIALLVTGYLTVNKLAGTQVVCLESGIVDCSAVDGSIFSEVAGIPVALLGFGAHLFIMAVLLLEKRVPPLAAYGVPVLFGVTLFGSIYHIYLTYVSITIIRAVCPYCLAAAAIMIAQFIIMTLRMRRFLAAPA